MNLKNQVGWVSLETAKKYLEELEYQDFEVSKDEALEMTKGQRFDYLFHSDVDTMSVPESQLKFRN